MLINGEEINTKHPNRHPLYSTWVGIKTRCYNPNHKCYNSYGGKGIYMCEEWKNSFVPFYNWMMDNGWKQGITIDRIDSDKPYEPSNCQLITQSLNSIKRNYQLFFFQSGEFNRRGYDEFSCKSINIKMRK